MNLTKEQRKQFNEILDELGKTLDITETEYDTAVSSYMAVGKQLSKDGSILETYHPEILPQGSFLIGTMIKPINEMDDLDIDLVCQLRGNKLNWTQLVLKHNVGKQIKENQTYEKMLEKPDGRRCWTLKYREKSDDSKKKYHMDILPAIVDNDYALFLDKAFRSKDVNNLEDYSIRITDKEIDNYSTEKNTLFWLKSNPFGYAIWFQSRAILENSQPFLLRGNIQEVPKFQKDKLPLQRIVQILKRHRDMLFSSDEDKEDKPISIIITTLAGKSYNKEVDVLEGLFNVVENMHKHIEEKFDKNLNRNIKWISNPVNDEENFADKWVEYPKREENFYKWLAQVKKDLANIISARGLSFIQASLVQPFGEEIVKRTFNNYGAKMLKARESNTLKMAANTGLIGTKGRTIIPQHQNFGRNE